MTEKEFNQWLDELESNIRGKSGYLGRRTAHGTTRNRNRVTVKKNHTRLTWSINGEQVDRRYLYVIDQKS